MLNKEKIHELVRVFYQQTSKTFYINSEDGKEFSKPIGVFVSLGMTTSMSTIENLKGVLENNNLYTAQIIEISSKKVEDQFLNTITSYEPKQYRLKDEDMPENVMSKEEVFGELDKLKEKLDPRNSLETITEYSPRITKLQRLVDRLNESNGWDSHLIQKIGESDYKIFHLLVNYEKREETEYRIGILIQEKN